MSDCRTHEYYPYDDGRPCPYCRIESLKRDVALQQRKYDALVDGLIIAIDNFDTDPDSHEQMIKDKLRALLGDDEE